ncbi:MAG: hypothetical protein D3906_07025 [Candidatus Electrothrix sp. AUS1_2]|nr:hypothetical protein [Candidatus Electrothrix sp. AUS1_2]
MTKQRIVQRLFYTLSILLLMLPAHSWGYEKEINVLSSAMAEKITEAGRKNIAVVDFTDLDGNVTQLGRFIAEELSGALAEKGQGFEVVNRSNLKLILKEHKLFEKGVIDQKAAMRLGEIAGVQALVTGTITPLTENIRLSVNVLDINTAKVIENKRENIPRTTDINELLNKEITVEAGGQTTTKKETTTTGTKHSQSSSNVAFFDDFNTGPKSDWKPVTGEWTMANGKYTVSYIQDGIAYVSLLEGKEWGDLVVNTDVVPGDTSYKWFRVNICPRMISTGERVCFGMAGKEYSFREAYWLVLKEGSKGDHLAKVPIETPSRQVVNIKIEVRDGIFTAYINDTQVNQIYDTTFTSGSVGLAQWYEQWRDPKIRIFFDNIKITPLSE